MKHFTLGIHFETEIPANNVNTVIRDAQKIIDSIGYKINNCNISIYDVGSKDEPVSVETK